MTQAKYTNVIVQAEVLFSYLDKFDEAYPGKYKCLLTNLSEDAAKRLTELGIDVKRNDEGAFQVKPTSKNKPVVTMGPDNEVFEGTIGNGSSVVAKLLVTILDKPMKVVDTKTDQVRTITHGLYIDKVKILDLVAAPGDDDLDADDAL